MKAANMPSQTDSELATQPPRASNGKTALPTPTRNARRHGKVRRSTIATWPEFKRVLRDNDSRLAAYVRMDRRNGVRLTRAERVEIDPSAALFLDAANAHARIFYTRITRRVLLERLNALELDVPVAFVTLISRRYTLGLSCAREVNLRSLKAWIRAELPDCSFVGMVEPAFYGNVGVVMDGGTRAVSWHAHFILWGVGRARLAALIDSVSRRNRTLVPGITAGHSRFLRRDQFERKILYMMKGAISEYRVWQDKDVFDPKTGEVVHVGTGGFEQAKQDLRSGDLARMTRVFSGKHLDDLAFAAGDGKEILRAINTEALAYYNRWLRVHAPRRGAILLAQWRPMQSAGSMRLG